MSSTPTPPVVPVPDDDDDAAADTLVGDDDRPLDPDANDDLVDSAEADRRAATEGELDGDNQQ